MVKNHSGFSLIELLVVVGIIALLGAIGVVSYGSARNKTRDAKRKADLEQIRSALEMYKADSATSVYPNSISFGGSLGTYLNPIPKDPLCPGTCPSGVYDYFYTHSVNPEGYVLSADLEIAPVGSLGCTPAANRNYCVKNP